MNELSKLKVKEYASIVGVGAFERINVFGNVIQSCWCLSFGPIRLSFLKLDVE